MLQAPPYATYKMRRSNNTGALVTPDWIIGCPPGLLVNCVVNYVDSVRQPRNTKIFSEIRWPQRGALAFKSVPLTVICAVPERQPCNSAMKVTQSSPQLQGAWSEKVFHDRVPSYPPMQTPKSQSIFALSLSLSLKFHRIDVCCRKLFVFEILFKLFFPF